MGNARVIIFILFYLFAAEVVWRAPDDCIDQLVVR